MSPEEFNKLPIIESSATMYNEPTGYTSLQQALLPYIDLYHGFLWVLFFGTMFFLLGRFLILPILQKKNAPAPLTEPTEGHKIKQAYWKLFSLGEIHNDVVVRLFGAAVLIGFAASFKGWENSFNTTYGAMASGQAICWPFFQGCYDLFFMNARPTGYIQNTIFMAMLGLIFIASYGLLARKTTLAHICIFILFLWKMYLTSINFRYNANYDYYQTAFTFIFLFVPHKRFFGSLSVAAFYFLSTATKIHESWSLGTYFTSMKTGLPVFPDEITILLTNIVIFMEMIGAWFLFSKNKVLQRTSFIFFFIFHLYSGTLVGYHYPTIVTPSLLIFFGPLFKPFDILPNGRKAIAGWLFILFLFMCQMISHIIPGDEKLTLEGNFYGLYMFEANHQCFATAYNTAGQPIYNYSSKTARDRCDPYRFWFRAQKKLCRHRPEGENFRLELIHSINGGPFYKIVDVPDICAVDYKPFSKNDWIKTEKEAEAVGRPKKNVYY